MSYHQPYGGRTRTCAGMVRDWRDYNVINKVFDSTSFDAETGVIFNADGSYLTVDFDENNESYIIRNSEGTVICQDEEEKAVFTFRTTQLSLQYVFLFFWFDFSCTSNSAGTR